MDYEVAELTWENGQLALHGFRQPRVAGGTLECVVNQATRAPSKHAEPTLAPWFQRETSIPASANTMDALVPCSYPTPSPTPKPENHPHPHAHPPSTCLSVPGSSGSLLVGSSTHVDSCSAPFPTFNPSRCLLTEERTEPPKRRRTRDGRDRAAHEVSSRNQSACGSDSLGSTRVTLDTCDVNLDVGFTSNTSLGSPENTSSAKPNSSYTKPITVDDFDSDSHGKPRAGGEDVKKGQARRSFISNKRSRAAAIHNQSERKRRDRINQRIKTLQKLVPNSSKTDKASMLDEVIEYLKQLQAQVQMMSRISTPQIMMPMTMQQLQMSMMAHMGMGMSMGMGMMDMNGIARTVPGGLTPMFHPAFPPLTGASWDGSGDRLLASGAMLPDPFSAFLACQTQSMTMDAYKRMVALYQQLHQPPNNNSKDPRN